MNVGFVSKNGRGWLSKSWNENIIVVLTHPSKKFTNILLSQLSFSARSTWAASTSITKSGFAEERRHTVVDIDWMDWDLEVCDIMQCWWRSISKRDPLVHQSMKNDVSEYFFTNYRTDLNWYSAKPVSSWSTSENKKTRASKGWYFKSRVHFFFLWFIGFR